MNPHDPVAGDRPDPVELAKAAASCFAGPHGRRLLQYLRAITVERALGPGVDDTHLRHLEGQRQLVHHLSTLIERGKTGPLAHDTPIDDQQRKRP